MIAAEVFPIVLCVIHRGIPLGAQASHTPLGTGWRACEPPLLAVRDGCDSSCAWWRPRPTEAGGVGDTTRAGARSTAIAGRAGERSAAYPLLASTGRWWSAALPAPSTVAPSRRQPMLTTVPYTAYDNTLEAGVGGLMSVRVVPGPLHPWGASKPALLLGAWDNRRRARVEPLGQVLRQADVTAAILADIQVDLRKQGVQVTAFSGVGAVTRAFLAQVRQEVGAVARARPIVWPAGVILTVRAQRDRFPPGGTYATQRDLLAGQPSALEAHAGAVGRRGRDVGVPTTLHTLSAHSRLPLERYARGLLGCPTSLGRGPGPSRGARTNRAGLDRGA